MVNFRRLAPMFMSMAVVGIMVGVFLFIGNSNAGTSSDGNFTITPKVNNTDNITGATSTQWVFTVTTTVQLVPDDIIRFVLPTTTTGSPFIILSPTSTAISGITLYKTLFPSPVVGVTSTFITSSSRPAFFGYINATTTSGTAFSITLGNVTNPIVASSSLSWTVEAGTPAFMAPPSQELAVTKFIKNAVSAIVAAGGDQGGSSAPVTNVVLADNDTTGAGLDGRDFTVTWSPTSSQPAGYQSTNIYITTSGVQLTTTNISTNGCGGSAPQMRGMNMQFTGMTTFTLPNFPNTDSCNQAYTTNTNYVAWVYTVATASSLASSTAVSYANASDVVTDLNAPQIMHNGAHGAIENIAAFLYATVFDDQTTGGQFANTSDGGAEYFKLFYTSSTWPGSPASVNAVQVSGAGELYSFTIPTTSVPAAGGTVKYYLVASDRASTPNVRYFCSSPSATSSASCQNNPFTITTAVAGSRSVSGKVTASGNNLASATVYVGGYAKLAATTDGSGDYTITGLPNNDSFDFTATKMGYGMANRRENVGTSDKTGINMTVYSGSMGFYAGGSGGSGGASGGAPNVVFSGPPEGMQGFPIIDNLRVGFSQPLNASTITTVSSVTSSNVYLVKTMTGENVPGAVSYCANQAAAGCSGIPSQDTNVILFNPTDDLTTSTQYTLVITSAVQGSSGQAIQGNRAAEGGHRINFSTMGGQISNFAALVSGGSFGNSGMYMPPYVKSMTPAPGMNVAPNTSVLLEFNEAMSDSTINSTNISLWTGAGAQVTDKNVSVSLDSNEKRFATMSHDALTAGEYEVRVKGAATNANGLPLRNPTSSIAFSSRFNVAGSSDATAPTIYPALANNSTGVATNKIFEFGFNEQLAFSTVNSTNITMYRGSTVESIVVSYDSGKNSVYVASASALSPNTAYTITFNSTVTDLAGVGMATTTYTYTTGAMDTTAPKLKEARCDDYRCYIAFSESMNHDTFSDSKWANSVINPANWTIARTAPSSATIDLTGKTINYDTANFSIKIEGLTGLAANDSYRVTASSTLYDLSDNGITTAGSANILNGTVESSRETFGSFGGGGMFGPPTENMMGSGNIGGGEFKPMGFGNFTANQFAMGQADMAFPFNPMASGDSNVFQIRFVPNVVLATGNQVVLTFPNGTTLTNTVLDTQSPFYSDFNQFMAGTVTGTALSVDSANNKVTITLGVSGTPNASDPITIDLKKIINPSIPKDPSSGGYSVGIKVLQSGVAVANKTSMPYFIMAGGTNTLVVDVVAGTATSSPTAGADGTVYLHGGGPGGPMDKVLTLNEGDIETVDGSAGTSVTYSSLPNGCYFIGTEPYVTLNGSDYYGQMSPEPVCLNSGETKTKWMLLTPASAGNTATLTVKMVDTDGNPYNFGGKDLDIFAGGPGKYVTKSLTGATTTASAGYQIKLNSNGLWNVGVGPAMPKGASGGKPVQLNVMPPPSVMINVNNIATTPAVTLGMGSTPPRVAFNDNTDTLTFTFATAASNKTVTGTVKDASGNGLANVDVFAFRQGFGMPIFTQTNASGTFSLGLSDYGNYQIGARKDGMPEVSRSVEVRNESGTKVYMDGKNVTGAFDINIKKASYSISGKVLDSSSNAVAYAPITAVATNGDMVPGQTSSDGSYTLFVENGTWTVRAELPPSKTDACGTFTKSVTVSGSSQSSQNITPSISTCYTLSGSISAGSALANVPIFVEQWNTISNAPVAGGIKKMASTDSSGAYSVKLGDGTYRVGVLDPSYGELSDTVTVSGTSTTKNISVTAATANFTFTGGTADMDAFIELKNNANTSKRVTKQQKGLNSTASLSVEDGATYSYYIDVFGIGKFNGTVAASATATVNLGLTGSSFITVTGTVFDNSGNAKSGALVTFVNATTTVTAVTDANGVYSAELKAGTYDVSDSLDGYIPTQATDKVFSASTTGYDFGSSTAGVADSDGQAPITSAPFTIEGTVSSSAGAAMTDGYVWATNASGTIMTAPIDSTDGTYTLAVTTGTWTIYGVGPTHGETTSTYANITVTTSLTNKNFALGADATHVPTSSAGILTANMGGSYDDSSATGMKLSAGGGVLESGEGDVSLNFEKSYTAPDTQNYQPLANASFSITAAGSSAIKDLTGNAEIQIDYSSLVASLPAGVSESDLKLMYFSPERGDYVPVEGGFTVDTSTNKITGQVDHFTDFVVAYTPSGVGLPTAPTGLSATAASASQINLSWTAVSGATSYTVYKSTDGITYTSITSPATNSYNVTSGLSASTLYYFKVTATNGTGEGASSDAASATTNAAASNGGSSADTTPPTGTSVVIASGAATTATTSVNLTLTATDASQMMIANDSAFTGGAWVTYSTTKAWVLTVGTGTKTVYAKFRDTAGNISTAVSDTINLTSTTTTTTVATTTPTVTTITTPPVVTTVPATVVVTPAVTVVRCKGNLNPGARGNAVKDLQAHLKELGYFTYPSNTGYYGAVTVKAVSAYQKAKGLPVNGKLNTATCDKLNGVTPVVATPVASTGSSGYKFTKVLKVGSTGEEVRQLQQLLKDLGYYTMPSVTGYYGAGTKAAVVKFQKAKGLKPYPGHLGPATRDALNSL